MLLTIVPTPIIIHTTMSKPEVQYVTNLHDHDVVLGRGSGPNDRRGNINFRSLCKEKKIAYIEAKSRGEKGRIAADIVATVHSRGGKFVKKLSTEQARKAGFAMKRGDADVYEVADEKTMLEKTKQTLRQNRADFVAEVEKEQGVAPVVGAYPIHQRKSESDADNNIPKEVEPMAVNSSGIENDNDSNIVNNIDPIPLGQSCGLDSMNHPNMRRSSAKMLLSALFGSSSDNNNSNFANSTRSMMSTMSTMDMSEILYDVLNMRSNGTETDSDNLFQSILNDCDIDEHMAEQVVAAMVQDSKSQSSAFGFTGEQKDLLLQYEEMQNYQLGRHQRQHGQEQQQQHNIAQHDLNDNANSTYTMGDSVFSSLVRNYQDDDVHDHLSGVYEGDCGNDDDGGDDPAHYRRNFRRSKTTGSEREHNIEPANINDESMEFSYRTAKDIQRALFENSSTTNMSKGTKMGEYSSSSSNRMNRWRSNSFDESMRSFMSMSLSELNEDPGPLPSRENSRGAPDEVKLKSHNETLNSLRISDLIDHSENDFQWNNTT